MAVARNVGSMFWYLGGVAATLKDSRVEIKIKEDENGKTKEFFWKRGFRFQIWKFVEFFKPKKLIS